MYQDREYFTYGKIHVSIDILTGEIRELFHEKNFDNLLKNDMNDTAQPFTVNVNENGKIKKYSPLNSRYVLNHPGTEVKFYTENLSDGLLVKVFYNHLGCESSVIECSLFYTLIIQLDTITFHLTIKNLLDNVINEIRFPVISGVYLGEDYSKNILVYPKKAGVKIVNPIDYFDKIPTKIHWRWMEYRYTYTLHGTTGCGRLSEYNLKGFDMKYPGQLSMSWLDLYHEDGSGGVYFGCHDKNCNQFYLEIGSEGNHFPGLVLDTAFETRIAKGEEYSTLPAVLYFHDGDWHNGADFYRAFKQDHIVKQNRITPTWLKECVGLVAHYDFKYQTGGIVHKYRDIPKLAEEAKSMGFETMLLSGWHKDGFDRGYPEYYFDEDLGGEQELIDGISYGKKIGVHTVLYINSRLHNTKYNAEELENKCLKYENGKMVMISFGNPDVKFAIMCPKSIDWQNELCQIGDRLTNRYGADGIYLDELGAGAHLCFNKKHGHAFTDFTSGYVEVLEKLRGNYSKKHVNPLILMGEWIVDAFGGVVNFQLNQSFFDVTNHFFPEMYRYTFPEHGITDMIYPSKNLAMRPVFVAQKSELLMAKIFTNGSFFWVYDLENVNTFKKDTEGMAVLKNLIALRKIQLKKAQNYKFVDDLGFLIQGSGTEIKRFTNKNRSVLPFFRFTDETVKIKFDFDVDSAEVIYSSGEKTKLSFWENVVELPQVKCGLLMIHEKNEEENL